MVIGLLELTVHLIDTMTIGVFEDKDIYFQDFDGFGCLAFDRFKEEVSGLEMSCSEIQYSHHPEDYTQLPMRLCAYQTSDI